MVTVKGKRRAQEKGKILKDHDEKTKERLEQMCFIFSSSMKKSVNEANYHLISTLQGEFSGHGT